MVMLEPAWLMFTLPRNTPRREMIVYAPLWLLRKFAVNVVAVVESTTTSSAVPVPLAKLSTIEGTILAIETGVTTTPLPAVIVVPDVVLTQAPTGKVVP